MPARLWPFASTVWLVTNVSWVPKLRYCSRHIAHTESVSRSWAVPGCGMQVSSKLAEHSTESNGSVGS